MTTEAGIGAGLGVMIGLLLGHCPGDRAPGDYQRETEITNHDLLGTNQLMNIMAFVTGQVVEHDAAALKPRMIGDGLLVAA